MPKNRNVREIDFGYTSAQQYWTEMVLPAYAKFCETPNRQAAISTSWPAWHVHEWLWYEQHPGVNVQGNKDYTAFRDRLIDVCEELGWVSDIADAGKHRYLGRPADVHRVHPPTQSRRLVTADGRSLLLNDRIWVVGGTELQIELTDGSRHLVSTVLSVVIKFWRGHFEGGEPLP